MSEKALQDLTDARFAKLFGRLQRDLGTAIETFLAEVQSGAPDVWLDDTRALAILEIVQGDVPLQEMRRQEPAAWWDHWKQDCAPAWFVHRWPVRYVSRTCEHRPWRLLGAEPVAAWKAHVRQRIEQELNGGSAAE